MRRMILFSVLVVVLLVVVLVGAWRSEAQGEVNCELLAQQIACGCIIQERGDVVIIIYVDQAQVEAWRALYAQYCIAPTPTPVPSLTATIRPATNGITPTQPAPGCDQFMPSGVGLVRFRADTPLRWGPDAQALTGYVAPAGQTAVWVGIEGDYIEIVWACSRVWVRHDEVRYVE